MKKLISAMACVSLFMSVFMMSARAEGIKAGKWSITSSYKTGDIPPEYAANLKMMENMTPEMKQMMDKTMKEVFKKRGMELQSMDFQSMSMTIAQCLTQQAPIPFSMSEYCQETHEINGNVVHFKMTCGNSQTASETTGSLTFNGDVMEGEMISDARFMNQALHSISKISGQYVGPCTP